MQLCQGADSEPHFCNAGSCQPFTCVTQDPACRIPGPYFPFVPQATRTLTRQGTDEPVIVDSVSTLMFTGCIAGMRGRECDTDTADWMKVPLEGAMYCANLTWASHDDWFLPDPWALLSLTVSEGENVTFAGDLATVPAIYSGTPSAIPWQLLPNAPSDSERPDLLSSLSDETFDDPTVLLAGSGIMNHKSFAPNAICVRLTKGTTPLPKPRNTLAHGRQTRRSATGRRARRLELRPQHHPKGFSLHAALSVD